MDVIQPEKKTNNIMKNLDGFSKTNIKIQSDNKTSMIGELDASCGFSGWCTPYKHTTKNMANKPKMGNDKKRQGRYKVAKSVQAATKDKLLSDNSNMQEDTGIVYKEVESGTNTCKICGQPVSSIIYKRHLKDCLKKHFHRSAKSFQEGSVAINKESSSKIKETIANKVLDCPLCGQALKTSRSRQIHLKRCAKKLEVSVQELYKCIHQQEEEYKLKVDAGILPEINQISRRHEKHKRNRVEQRTSSTSSVRLEQPQSKLDEETQLALALSESLRKDHDKEMLNKVDSCVQHTIPETALCEVISDCVTKDAFSVLMTPKQDNGASRKKTRKQAFLKTTYQLERETADSRIRKLEHKIGLILSSQEMTDICPTPRVEPSALVRHFHSTDFDWWFISSQPSGEKKAYYVKQLQPHIMPSDLDISRKLMKTANNPRQMTQKMPDSSVLQVRSDSMPCSSFDSTSNQTLVASTQTVVLLAEMASDTTEMDTAADSSPTSQDHSHNKTVQLTLPENKQHSDDFIENSGFAVSEQLKKPQTLANNKLIKDMMSLLISEQNADISIVCSNDSTVQAHSLIIQARCPALLKHLTNGQIMLQQYSKGCIQTLLRYIYTADLSMHEYLTEELGSLAKRYDLEELGMACFHTQLLKKTLTGDELIYEDTAIHSHDLIDKTLQHLLHDAWGSDPDDEGEDQHSVTDNNDSNLSSRSEELELDELYELVVSQKHKSPSDSEGEMRDDGSSSHDTNEDVKTLSDMGSTMLNIALLKKLHDSFMSETTGFSQNDKARVSLINTKSDDGREQDLQTSIMSPADNLANFDDEVTCLHAGKQVAGTPVNVFKFRACDETTPNLFSADDSDVDIGDADIRDAVISDAVISNVDIIDAGQADGDDNDTDVSHAAGSDVFLYINGQSYKSSCKHPDDNKLVSHSENINNMNSCNTEGELTQNCTRVSSQHTCRENKTSSQDSSHSKSFCCETRHKRKRTSPSHHNDDIQIDIQFNKQIRMKPDYTKTKKRGPGSSPVLKSKPNSVLEDDEKTVDETMENDQKETCLTHESHLAVSGQLRARENQPAQCLTEAWSISVTEYDAGSLISVKEQSSFNVQRTDDLPDGSEDNKDENHDDSEQASYSAMDTWDDFDDVGGYDQFDKPFTQEPCIEDEVSSISSSKIVTCNEDNDIDLDKLSDRSSLHCAANESILARQSLETHPDQAVLNEGSSKLNKEAPEHLASPFKIPAHKPRLKCSGRRQVSDHILMDLDTDIPDIEGWNEDFQLPSEDSESPVKTPMKQQIRKCWVPPSPFSPMSDYNNMSTPELKKACHKVGVKPLQKKKMVAVLKDIYHKTHAYETDTDYEGTPCRPSVRNPTVTDPRTKPKTCKSSKRDELIKAIKSTQISVTDMNAESISASSQDREVDKVQVVASNADKEDDSVNSSQEMNSSCSQDSSGTCSDLPEESMFIVDDNEPKQKMSKTDISYKRQRIWDFITADKDLYMKILHFEPLDINSFHHHLKSAGLNIGVRIVMDFLDDQNVLFTLKNQPTTRRKKKVSQKSLSASQSNKKH